MVEVENLMDEIINGEELIEGVLSKLRNRQDISYERVNIKPVLVRDGIKIQFTYEFEDKVEHRNLNYQEALDELNFLFHEKFRQGNIFTRSADYQIMISKRRKVRIIEQEASKKAGDISHNRKKKYLLEDGKKHDFLIRLGIMDREGRVIPRRYDKFRQINRFLELVEDVIPEIKKEETINIIDFGCGKSYLTFGLYYYLVEILDFDVNIIGLDLKKDVIEFCNQVAEDLDYQNLEFIHGDIRDFQEAGDIDMVVTLHACDTATDAALVKAIDWDARVILSVPCCQSEFFSQLDNKELEPMLKHGIIKERLSSLVTDSLRGKVLEVLGYNVQLVEFIDMEHTHKNILIRAIKDVNFEQDKSRQDYRAFKEFWNLDEIFIEEELKKIDIKL